MFNKTVDLDNIEMYWSESRVTKKQTKTTTTTKKTAS